ncbi:MAG: DUF6398 domain-containing protein [Opitutaceae bacterium]|jgi:hypothetical protein|nr:DUF6398 domain-containing protein [Opitutaceae bacterium]
MAVQYNEISALLSRFWDEKQNKELKESSLGALAKLCRKRPSPLARGATRIWACGIAHAIARNNFLFDKTLPNAISAPEIAAWFNVAQSTASAKAAFVTNALDLSPLDMLAP